MAIESGLALQFLWVDTFSSADLRQQALRSRAGQIVSVRHLAYWPNTEPGKSSVTVDRRHAEVHCPTSTVHGCTFAVDRRNAEVHASTSKKHGRTFELGQCRVKMDRCRAKVRACLFTLRLWTIEFGWRNIKVHQSNSMKRPCTVELQQRTFEVDECNAEVHQPTLKERERTFQLHRPGLRWSSAMQKWTSPL